MGKFDAEQKAAPLRDWADWSANLAARGLIRAALALPWQKRSAFMAKATRHAIAPLAGYRARALANLSHVFPQMPDAETLRIANLAAENAGRTLIENYATKELLERMAHNPIGGEGLEELLSARASGRPVLLLTAHYGNFEAPRAALVARGHQIGGLYRPMRNHYFNAHYAQNMHALSGPVFEQSMRGTLGLMRHIRDGGMGVLLFDIYTSSGAPIDFLGKPAPTATSAAEIALKTGALLLPFFATRQENAIDFDITFEASIPESSPHEMMQEATRRLEARVNAHPEQWFWLHRRWKPERQAKLQRKRNAASTGP